ncbi:Na/Pi symporter [Paraliobacillus ryukyuensis]|uniref:Na/Pi symporter n=1 Tax=Paraliobacillus ryukyuensis TaxID=200904 RepID=UPI0009A7038C|nr:Na/Pi symporter [Paraliobacillus ryukyuensis]
MELLSYLGVYLILFFMGMRLLQNGLIFYTESRLTDWISSSTNHLVKSVLIGMTATALLQSSSVVLIITISLVTIDVLTYKQTIGIILGANIGTTMTGELLTINHILPYPLIFVIGVICLILNKQKIYYFGCVCLGLGSIFIAMNGFQSLMPIVNRTFTFTEIFTTNEYVVNGIVIGTIASAILQSSSATFALTAAMVQEGVVPLTNAIAIILGSNIGTCVTGLIAAITASKQAKLVAITHTAFNIITVCIAVPFYSFLQSIAEQLATEPIQQLAHIAVIFNVFSVLIVLPFIPFIINKLT